VVGDEVEILGCSGESEVGEEASSCESSCSNVIRRK
jgi:hypothetical protein